MRESLVSCRLKSSEIGSNVQSLIVAIEFKNVVSFYFENAIF